MPQTVVSRPLLLVVDSELPTLRVIGRLASKMGFEVITCPSASEAVRGLTRQPADLAMIDLGMQGGSGRDLLREIRSAVPACEVILMTPHAGIDGAVEPVTQGARECMAKPLDFQRLRQLFSEVRDELERRAQIGVLESRVARGTGNVLELRKTVGRAHVLAEGAMISERELKALRPTGRSTPLETLERDHLLDVLRQVSGNRMAAAKALGISRRALYRRLDRYHIVARTPGRTIGRRLLGD